MRESAVIECIKVRQLSLTPAITLPERLADCKAFDVVLVEVRLASDAIGYGDALVVDGWTPETLEQAWLIICTLAESSIGFTRDDAAQLFMGSHRAAPHAVTALMAALETASGMLSLDAPVEFPLTGLVETGDTSAVYESLELLRFGQWEVVRLNLEGNVPKDLAMIERVRSAFGGRVRLRLGGVQAYAPEDAVKLVTALDPKCIDWLDQPCVAGDWDAASAVRNAARIPLAMSGFVFDDDDIGRAVEAADIVGFGFAQMGGRDALRYAISIADAQGLRCFLGGGLQTDLTTLQEVLAVPGALLDITSPSVALEPVLAGEVSIVSGLAKFQPSTPPQLNEDTLARCTLQELTFC